MAQQKSEDRVVPEGGVMPAEPAGSSPGGQGKAVPVEETAGQLRLPIATAENPARGRSLSARGPVRGCAMRCRRRSSSVDVTPVTMEEVVEPLDGGAGEGGVEQGSAWPGRADGRGRCESSGRSLAGVDRRVCWTGRIGLRRDPPGVIPKAEAASAGLGIPNVVDRVVRRPSGRCSSLSVSRRSTLEPRVPTGP